MSRHRRDSLTEMIDGLRRSRAPRWLIALAVVVVLAVRFLSGSTPLGESASPIDTGTPGQTAVVLRVVDGDTLLLENRDRIRLLGVDTPETVREGFPVEPWGPEASAFTKRLVEGRRVELAFDRERQDRHGRLLAYVTIDGTLLNEELIREGLGRALLQYPYSDAMKKRFRQAEDEARQAQRGIWSDARNDLSR